MSSTQRASELCLPLRPLPAKYEGQRGFWSRSGVTHGEMEQFGLSWEKRLFARYNSGYLMALSWMNDTSGRLAGSQKSAKNLERIQSTHTEARNVT